MPDLATTTQRYSRLGRLLPLAAGIVLVSAGFCLDFIATEGMPSALPAILGITGCMLATLAFLSMSERLRIALAKASLALLSIVTVTTLAEVFCRFADFDFARPTEPGADVPIYYRTPSIHAGEGIFRRPGPASWEGKVLAAYMRLHGAPEGPYAQEQPVLAQYDSLGFRNSTNLADWDIVVAGDSFVEQGYLANNDLLTAVAARQLGLRIKNLGVSGTGPLSQAFYLQHYGKSASTKTAVLCFFEGNDLEDLSRELRNREAFRRTGHPCPYPRQTSLLKAVYARLVTEPQASRLSLAGVTPNARLVSTRQERPMTVYGLPPAWDRLSPKKRQDLLRALADWARTARALALQPWLMYLPDSHRVFHGMIRYANTNSPVALWTPGDFAGGLGQTCTNLNIRFINAFPALRREAETGATPYNLIGDTHLSLEGTRLIARLLSDALKPSP